MATKTFFGRVGGGGGGRDVGVSVLKTHVGAPDASGGLL